MPEVKSAELQVNQAIEADAPDTNLIITVDADNPLKVGTYSFQLVVTDNAGNTSAPATVKVTVIDDAASTAIIDVPVTVGFGKGFTLSGRRSTDVGQGTIAKYSWTLLSVG